MNIKDKIRRGLVFVDGGTGTSLQAMGLEKGELPENWNITQPDKITALHRAYFEAGANIVSTNTFGANAFKFDGKNGNYSCEAIISAAIANAKAAVKQTDYLGTDRYVAFDIGPCGKMLEPFGDLPFEAAVELFAREVRCAAKCGVDLILIETMGDLYEVKAAVLAAKENCSLPVFCSCAFDRNGKLLTGGDVKSLIALLEGLGVDALGMNCSFGPRELLSLMPDFAEYASVPVLVSPNAGLPTVKDGKTVYDFSPEEFACVMADVVRAGARIVGGCCGTTPEHIRALVEAVSDIAPLPVKPKTHTLVSSYTHAVELGNKPVIIGERINPTGKPKLKAALREGDIDYVLNEGFEQKDCGAHILDVNVGLPELDEPRLLCEAVSRLQAIIDLPLQLDTSNITAMEKAMRLYNGKPLVNSVNGKAESMAAVLPLVKKYGGAVIALTLDENGIPDTAQGRADIAGRIIETASQYGIPKCDIIVDPLALTISSSSQAARVTLDSVKLIHGKYGVCTSLGVSNVSFGLPNREFVNATFFAAALESGLSAAIINPRSQDMLKTYYSFCAIAGFDENCADYIEFATRFEPTAVVTQNAAPKDKLVSEDLPLQAAIVKGVSKLAGEIAAKMLADIKPQELINEHIIPALDTVGKAFESNKVFLPELLMSAQASNAAFAAARNALASGEHGSKKGKILLATVKGDIHDIGKNIVKVLLENYGYDVIDLGRDVDASAVVDTAVRDGIRLIGLSALMTTTVSSMEDTINRLRLSGHECRIVVGGAVLTKEYADMIGADYYAKDAMETVRIAEELFKDGIL